MSIGNVDKAIPLLTELLREHPANANLHYLLGVCYTEGVPDSAKSIEHLEKATLSINLSYDPGSYVERLAPVFVYYYLVIAYSQNGRCLDAKWAIDKFGSLYGGGMENYYIKNARMSIDSCNRRRIVRLGLSDTLERSEKLVTKDVSFFTPSPLYGVQVGAYSLLTPVSFFENLKNVDAYLDKDGKIVRYVVGLFVFRSQAELLKEIVISAGYSDAFVVDINETSRYSREIVSIDDISLKYRIEGKVDFRIQIGAFRDSIPGDLLFLYMQVDGIREQKETGMTVLTTGSYPIYEEAEKRRDELLNSGIPGTFIVAFNYNKKVSVKQAISYLKRKMGNR